MSAINKNTTKKLQNQAVTLQMWLSENFMFFVLQVLFMFPFINKAPMNQKLIG